jgi:hypothetical protein
VLESSGVEVVQVLPTDAYLILQVIASKQSGTGSVNLKTFFAPPVG